MAYEDPGWNRASNWLGGDCENPRTELHVLGVPMNRSVTPGSCHLAPKAIREALFRFGTYSFSEESDLRQIKVKDHGDSKEPEVLEDVCKHGRAVFLGGDNGVTRPAVKALAKSQHLELSEIGVITLDAHLDLRHLNDGPMNGNPIRGLIEDGLPGANIVQIGLQSFANSPEYARFGEESGIRMITAEQCFGPDFDEFFRYELNRISSKVKAVYFDLDIDVMDRAFAPGCPGSRPGGLTPVMVRQAARIAGANKKVLAMDIVELDPELDINSCTAMACAACLLEFASGVLASS
ncbi:MAG: agmatinase family protein [Armatimonadota bacterium]